MAHLFVIRPCPQSQRQLIFQLLFLSHETLHHPLRRRSGNEGVGRPASPEPFLACPFLSYSESRCEGARARMTALQCHPVRGRASDPKGRVLAAVLAAASPLARGLHILQEGPTRADGSRSYGCFSSLASALGQESDENGTVFKNEHFLG